MQEINFDRREFTGSLATATATLAIPMHSMAALALQFSGTFAGFNVTFEISNDSTDGVNGEWKQTTGTRTGSATTVEQSTGVINSPVTYGWVVNTFGYRWFRVRATARTSGTLNVSAVMSNALQAVYNQSVAGTVALSGTPVVTPNTAVTSQVLNSAASTNLTSVKATAGTLYTLHASNNGAGVAFLKLYNKASAPVLASDVPLMIIPIPAAGFVHLPLPMLGKRFTSGIAFAITGLIADNDATAVAAGQVKLAMDYI